MDKWISVHKKMPTQSGSYLVCMFCPEKNTVVYRVEFFSTGKAGEPRVDGMRNKPSFYRVVSRDGRYALERIDVDAWMPLPGLRKGDT